MREIARPVAAGSVNKNQNLTVIQMYLIFSKIRKNRVSGINTTADDNREVIPAKQKPRRNNCEVITAKQKPRRNNCEVITAKE